MLWFHAFEWSTFWVFTIIAFLILVDLVGAFNNRLEPTAVGFIGALLAVHLFGVFDIATFVYEHWIRVLIGIAVWLVIGLAWMVFKYKWFLREGMREIYTHEYDIEIRKREAQRLSYENNLNELVTWWIFWLPSMLSTFILNLWSTLKFFIVEVCGQWLKGIWKREFERIFKSEANQ